MIYTNLEGVNLREADLVKANLSPIKGKLIYIHIYSQAHAIWPIWPMGLLESTVNATL